MTFSSGYYKCSFLRGYAASTVFSFENTDSRALKGGPFCILAIKAVVFRS